jgi:putative acetyltransferase
VFRVGPILIILYAYLYAYCESFDSAQNDKAGAESAGCPIAGDKVDAHHSGNVFSVDNLVLIRRDREPIDLLRATLPEHIGQVRALFLEYGSSLDFSLCFQSFDEEVKNLPGAYGPPSGVLLLAHCADHAAGCIALRKLEAGICEMKRLYVRPGDRGRGLGRMLVERLIAEARVIGYERMRLAMKDAIALYRQMGFQEIAPYSSIPVESALWMELRL